MHWKNTVILACAEDGTPTRAIVDDCNLALSQAISVYEALVREDIHL